MEEISIYNERKRAEDLVRQWQLNRTKELDLDVRGIEFSTETIIHYVPYILATIYYSWMNYRELSKYKTEKEWEKVNLWLDKSVDKVMQLAPGTNIDEENCKNDIIDVMNTMNEKISLKNPTFSSEVISDKMFGVLQKYYPDANTKEKDLIDYIVKAELTRLMEQF